MLKLNRIFAALMLPVGVVSVGVAASDASARQVWAHRGGNSPDMVEYVSCNNAGQKVQAVTHGLNASDNIVCHATFTSGTTQYVACPDSAVKHRAGIGLGMDWAVGPIVTGVSQGSMSPQKTWAVRNSGGSLCEVKSFRAYGGLEP
jgi:hypothetical protein